MPSVLFLNRYYWPDLAATAQQLTDLAEDLAARGWDVTVVSSRAGYDDPSIRYPRREERRGVTIERLWTTRFGRVRVVGRLIDYVTYMVGALLHLLFRPAPDIVVAASDPPFTLAPALLARRFRSFATVFYAQDIYPDLAAKLGLLREEGLPYRGLAALARRMHRSADAVITLGPGMAETLVANGARPETTTWVRHGADTRAIEPVAAGSNPLREEHGLGDAFVIMYSGNAGRAHTFDVVLEAARRLRDEEDIVFLFVGGGSQRPALEAAARSEALPNIRFLGYFPRDDLRYSLSMADLSLVTERPSVAKLLVPCKTYGIMASGRPVLFVGSEESEIAEIVHEAECGFVVSPDDPDTLTDIILRLRESPAELAALGERSRRAAETIYERSRVAEQWREELAAIRGRSRSGAGTGQSKRGEGGGTAP